MIILHDGYHCITMNERNNTTDVTDGEPVVDKGTIDNSDDQDREPIDETDRGPEPALRNDPTIAAEDAKDQ